MIGTGPAAVPITDAARLTLVEHEVVPFRLSMCDIAPGAAFHLLKFRQNAAAGAKDLSVPVMVSVTADLDPTQRLGELRRFKHKTTDPEERPIPGDSGSPILDGEGRVVGLLTAIKDDNLLYVTPTSSFVELIPEEQRNTIACYNAVTQDQIATLENRIKDLEARLTTAEETYADLVTKVDSNENLIKSTIMQMLIDAKNRREISEEELLEALSKVADLDPVIPVMNTVRRSVENMARDLSELDWGFWLVPGQTPTFNVKYERGISGPLFAETLFLCYRPLVDFKPSSEPRQHKQLNYKSIYFYMGSEEGVITRDFMTDCAQARRQPQVTKSATYSFNIRPPVFSEADYPMLDFGAWDGSFYAYTVYKDRDPQTGEVIEKILHRFVLEVPPSGNIQETLCYEIPAPDSETAIMEMANFFKLDGSEERKIFECREL